MPSYIFRNRYNKVIRGTTSASSEQALFDKIDDQANPHAFEYCKSTRKTLWLDEEPVWLIFNDEQVLVSAKDAEKEIMDSLHKKISESKFDDYTCFVMARNHLANNDLDGAIQRIRVDMDKLICLDKKLYDYINFLSQN